MSPEQRAALGSLSAEYGTPDIAKLGEFLQWPLLWLHWGARFTRHPEMADRNLFVMPNGDRLTWEQVPLS